MTDHKPQGTNEATSGETQHAKAPSRRCICCRGNGAKQGLLRFGIMGGTLMFDLRQKLPGRGFYVCAKADCLKKAWDNAFKRVAKTSPQTLAESPEVFIETYLVPGYHKRYRECLLAGRQSGQLILGSDAVEQAAREDRLSCYILATDASESTKKKYRLNAERKGLPCIGLLDRSAFGQLLGSSDKVVLGWQSDSLIGAEFQRIEAVLRSFDPSLSKFP